MLIDTLKEQIELLLNEDHDSTADRSVLHTQIHYFLPVDRRKLGKKIRTLENSKF